MFRILKSWFSPKFTRNARRRVPLGLESLGERLVPASVATANYYPLSGILSIEGTDRDDIIDIRQEDSRVAVQGLSINVSRTDGTGYSVGAVDTAAITRIDVRGLGGNDTIMFRTVLGASAASNQANRAIPVRFDGGVGDDRLTGGDGNDVLIGGAGTDTIDGGKGADTLFGDAEYIDVITILGQSSPLITYHLGAIVLYTRAEPFTNVDYPDYLPYRDVAAIAGHDVLRGGDGADTLYGGYGNDWLLGEAGDDMLFGMDGADLLIGDDTGVGDASNDYLFGGTGSDYLFGGRGHDVAVGGMGDDWVYGGEGNDHLYGRDGQDRLYGEG